MLRVREALAGVSLPRLHLRWGRLVVFALIGFQIGSCGAASADTRYRTYYSNLYRPAPAASGSNFVTGHLVPVTQVRP